MWCAHVLNVCIFHFPTRQSGDTRVGLVGFPSVGKSTLLSKLTGTTAEIAAYEFTTLTAIPGTMHYKGARIQVLDLPGIIEGAKDGKGRGKQVIGAARTCNIILIVLDATKPLTHKRVINRELEGFGIRLNKTPPDIVVRKKDKGGVAFQSLRKYQTSFCFVWYRSPLAIRRVWCTTLQMNKSTWMKRLSEVYALSTSYQTAKW